MAEAEKVDLKEVPVPVAVGTQKAVAVPPQLSAEILEVLTTELPMKRVRGVVQMLEQCPVMDVGPSK